MFWIPVIVFAIVLVAVFALGKGFSVIAHQGEDKELNPAERHFHELRQEQVWGTYYVIVAVAFIGALCAFYFAIQGTPWEGHFREWLNIIVRLAHFTFGIAWIGASFYFVFLENSLNRTHNLRDELAGDLWAVHGGGFYYLEKYKLAPKTLPRELHWFKYEAYFTWVTGVGMLFVVYYFNASSFLVDKNVLDISSGTAIAIGLGSLVVAWLLYDFLCKTPLINHQRWFALVGFVLAGGFAYFYTQVFSGRAAYIHFGAMLGTIMAANVYFVIIPSQKAMVKAAIDGVPVNPMLGKMAGLRSRHNNYTTLPVLFAMVSNHFPSTFGAQQPWLVLIIIALGTAGIKHYLNLTEAKQKTVWILPISIAILVGVAIATAPPLNPGACKSEVSFMEVQGIIQQRCQSCHSSRPTDPDWPAPPAGVVYDTPDDIVRLKDRIMERAVINKNMPQNNKTNMTPEERDAIRCWIEQGAKR